VMLNGFISVSDVVLPHPSPLPQERETRLAALG
jgi:hypothetical protein